MKVDAAFVKHVASLARLHLSDDEIKKFIPELQEVLNHFSKLAKADISNTKPSFQPIELKNAVREDTPLPCLSNEGALRNTPHKKDGYFKGPKVLS